MITAPAVEKQHRQGHRDFTRRINLAPCFTPVASPQLNGMSEAFVRAVKRDHVRINPLPDALTVLQQVHGWF